MNNGRIVLVLLLYLVLTSCSHPRPPKISRVLEGPIQLPSRQGHVNDFVGVIDRPGKQKLESDLDTLNKQIGIDFVIVVVKSTDGYSIQDHSMEIARQWQLDRRPLSRGEILLDIALDDQEFRFNVSKPLWNDLPNEEIEEFQRGLERSFSAGQYTEGLFEVVSKINANSRCGEQLPSREDTAQQLDA